MRLDAPAATTTSIVLQPAPAEYRAVAAMLTSTADLLSAIRHPAYPRSNYSSDDLVAPTLQQALGQANQAVAMLTSSAGDGWSTFKGGIESTVTANIQRAQQLFSTSATPYSVLSAVEGAVSGARAFADALNAAPRIVTSAAS